MKDFVFYCVHCDQIFSGEFEDGDKVPNCPRCERKTVPTGITRESWLTYSKEERQNVLDRLAKEYVENEARNRENTARRERYAEQAGVDYQEKEEKLSSSSFVNFLYDNIGGKIKIAAIVAFMLEALCTVMGGITLAASDEDMIFPGLCLIVVGPLIAYFSSWVLFAFGELVDKTVANEKNTRNILKILLENSTQNKNE